MYCMLGYFMHFMDIAAEPPFTSQTKMFDENVTLKGPLPP